jgi:hypothetical protein
MIEDLEQKETKQDLPGDEFSLAGITPTISPIAAAFIGLIGGFFLYQIVGGTLTLLIFGLNMKNASVNGLRLMTMAGEVLFILLPALLFTKWFYKDITRVLRVKIPEIKELYLFTVGLVILIPLLQAFMTLQNYYLDKLAQHYHLINYLKSLIDKLDSYVETTYEGLIKPGTIPEAGLIILIVAIVPAICEETMFRGFIQRSFEFRMKPFKAALLTAIFFGLYHFNPYGLIALIALGLYLGYASYSSNSIILAMFLHFLNNFSAIIIYFAAGNKEMLDNAPATAADAKMAFIVFLALLLLFAGVIYLIRHYYSQKIMRNENANMP